MPNGALCLADAGLEVHKAAGSASCANGASATPDWRWLGAKGGATCTGRGIRWGSSSASVAKAMASDPPLLSSTTTRSASVRLTMGQAQ